MSELVRGSDGNFYGTTSQVGANGLGTVFKITPAGTLTTLNSFAQGGSSPYGGLVQASDGNFYGTTTAGGTSSNCLGGCGIVFKMTPSGTMTTLTILQPHRRLPSGGLDVESQRWELIWNNL